jgi:hypothetical protein
VFSISSCTVVGTLYPISDNSKVLIAKSELVGKWWDTEDSTYYIIIDSLANVYGADYKIYGIENFNDEEVADTLSFLGKLTKIDGWYFFEYWSILKKEMGDFAVARHFVMRLSFPGNDKIEITNFNADELLKHIDQKKIHLSYASQRLNSEYESYNYLILDKTPALRNALIETMKYPKVYGNKITFTRLQGSLF